MQILSNRFEISGAGEPIFAATDTLVDSRRRPVRRSIPILNPGETRGNATFPTLTINVKPLSASQMDQTVPLTLKIGSAQSSLADIPFRISRSPKSEIKLTSEGQHTPWRFTFRVNPTRNQIIVSFTLDYSGLSVLEALEGANFYEALVDGGTLLITGRNPITGGEVPLVKGNVPSGAYKSNAKLVSLLNHLRFIEIQTKSAFTFPTEPITVQEANDIAAVANLLRTGHATYTAKPWVSLTPIQEAKRVLDSFSNEVAHPMAVHFRDQVSVILGEHVPLGPVTLFCDRTIVTAEDFDDLQRKLESSLQEKTVAVRFTPFEGCPVEGRYINWVSQDEAAQLKELPMYRDPEYANPDQLSLQQINADYALDVLESWYQEDNEEEQETWRRLKAALNEDRLSDRNLFT